MRVNTWLAVAALLLILSGIAAIFWQQELQYTRPTPIPQNYVPVRTGAGIALGEKGLSRDGRPVLLHFFNPDCPCSRFNLKHFKTLVKSYGKQLTFIAVVPEPFRAQTEQIRQQLDLGIPVIADQEKELARRCGVYATPQAVLVGRDGKLYYRGNYNKSRYCTTKNSNYAQMAVDSLLADAPAFGAVATDAYGCELPEPGQYESLLDGFFSRRQ